MAGLDAILFDLDDTLLGNDMDVFLRSYFPLLAAYAEPVIAPDKFLSELLTATQAMIDDVDPSLTNRQVFWQVFCERNGLVQDEVEPFLAGFYRERFHQLQSTTQRRPQAASLVRWCMDQGLKVVVATNPLFPLDAIEQRLAWAGIPVDKYDYDLVTGYENMHSAKPHSAYYREILSAVDIGAERALMVGDDWNNDIVPTAELGLATYWIAPNDTAAPGNDVIPNSQGDLQGLFTLLQDGWPQN